MSKVQVKPMSEAPSASTDLPVQSARKGQLRVSKVRKPRSHFCMALLLVLVFSTSAFIHTHALTAATDWQEAVTFKADATGKANVSGEPCCPDSSHPLDGAGCSISSGCSLWIPTEPSSAAVAPSEGESTANLPDDTLLGRAPPPQFRPPQLSVNA